MPKLWAIDDEAAAEEARLSGWGDLPYAGRGRPVPAVVQLGVLAHAWWGRLDTLRAATRFSRTRRVWGADVLVLTDAVLDVTGSATGLRRFQRERLAPLEHELRDATGLTRAELLDRVAPLLVRERP